jgi:3-oxoacyl-[acyl-carrier-protein] synthase-3
MGAEAARMALSRAGISASDVGLLIGGGCAPDTTSPAEACNIGRILETTSPALDMNSACSSFIAGINMLAMMDESKLPHYVLLVCAEVMTRTVDYSDRSAAVLWGDGAIAAVFSTREPGRARIEGTTMRTDPAGADKVVVPRIGFFNQEGRTVQSFAIRKTSDLFLKHREEFETETNRLHFIGHQANLRMLESVCRRCEIAEDRHHSNCEFFGNTGGASSGSVISQNWDKWKAGDDLSIVGVGSGLTWGSYLLRFDKNA